MNIELFGFNKQGYELLPTEDPESRTSKGIPSMKHNMILYTSVDNGKQYITLIVNHVHRPRYTILSYKEYDRQIIYQCNDGIELQFIRIYSYIQMIIAKNGKVYLHAYFDSKEPFEKLSCQSGMVDRLALLFDPRL